MSDSSEHLEPSAFAAGAAAPADPDRPAGPAAPLSPASAGPEGEPGDTSEPAAAVSRPSPMPAAGEPSARQHETIVEIAAPAEAVWQALTQAEDLMRWFAPQARVTPGAGGEIWLSWGEGFAGASRIEIWEPDKRLRTLQEGGTNAAPQVAVDYFITAGAGGRTVLRLVHSGFGAGAEWDDEFEGTRRGWPMFFAALKHDLERHRGETCRRVNWCRPVALPAASAWDLLASPRGLGAAAALAGLHPGSSYHFRTAGGDELTGTVLSLAPPGHAILTVEPLHGALLSIFSDTFGDQTLVTVGWTLYGPAADDADDLRRRWNDLLGGLMA
jgi:uncharacterized protein YndB with AHSA1/START domain